MELNNLIREKIGVSKYLFDQFCKAYKVNDILEYCLKGLSKKGEFEDIECDKVEFFIHGSNIDFIYKGKQIICYYINYSCFNPYSLFVFYRNTTKADFDTLEDIQRSIDSLVGEKALDKVNGRDWYFPIRR